MNIDLLIWIVLAILLMAVIAVEINNRRWRGAISIEVMHLSPRLNPKAYRNKLQQGYSAMAERINGKAVLFQHEAVRALCAALSKHLPVPAGVPTTHVYILVGNEGVGRRTTIRAIRSYLGPYYSAYNGTAGSSILTKPTMGEGHQLAPLAYLDLINGDLHTVSKAAREPRTNLSKPQPGFYVFDHAESPAAREALLNWWDRLVEGSVFAVAGHYHLFFLVSNLEAFPLPIRQRAEAVVRFNDLNLRQVQAILNGLAANICWEYLVPGDHTRRIHVTEQAVNDVAAEVFGKYGNANYLAEAAEFYFRSLISLAIGREEWTSRPNEDTVMTVGVVEPGLLGVTILAPVRKSLEPVAVLPLGTFTPKEGKPQEQRRASRKAAVAGRSSENKVNPLSLDPLEDLIGLDPVKDFVRRLEAHVKVRMRRREMGLETDALTLHTIFTGNPGTGKTTVARIIGRRLKDLGVLKKGHVVETDRAGLVGEYVGTTAPKTLKMAQSAFGGILFIDEAYTLARGGENDFGREAIDTLVKVMEDHRDELVVILAGYTDEMEHFLETNPGLKSRFPFQIEFPDYAPEEMLKITERLAAEKGYELSPSATAALQRYLAEVRLGRDGGNGRFCRNLLEKSILHQNLRVAKYDDYTKETLVTIEEEDVQAAIREIAG